MRYDIVIAGAGQAGLQCAVSLREAGFAGSIALVGDERHPPYMRPPLSKGFLKGLTLAEDLPLRQQPFLSEARIDLLTGARVERIDRAARRVDLAGGGSLAYGRLVLATGTRVRRLPVPGADLAGVHHLRGIDDADALVAGLVACERVVVIGGGFIGLEVAAAARERGRAVTVVERADRVMARAVSPEISAWFADLHRTKGVDLVFGVDLGAIAGRDGRVAGVALADGRVLAADLVVAGVGVVPNDDLAADAGLAVGDGILVDRTLATGDPAIFAIGDCARFPDPRGGRSLRLESIQNAVDQAKHVAACLVQGPQPYRAVPWFWTEQFGARLQIAGLAAGRTAVERTGDPATGRFSLHHVLEGELVAVESVNQPGEHLKARRHLLR